MTATPTDQDLHELPTRLGIAATRTSFLRQSLIGEYLSLALIIHASFGSALWAASSLGSPATLTMVAAGVWIVARAAGAFASQAFAPFVTMGLVVVTLLSKQHLEPTTSYLWFFSPAVFVLMLGILFVSDLAEWGASPLGSRILNRLRQWNWHRIAIWAFLFAFLIYMVAIPIVSSILDALEPTKTSEVLKDEMSLAEKIRLRSMEGMTGLVFFAFGATIGSFLNVVVFRMPRGESVVFRPSRCPQCETEIKGRDNVPIFGWLLLNGRCRACQTSISPRYPIVESVCATMFLLLFFVELISGGANLPVRKPNFYHGVVWIIFYTKWDLIGIYLFHCFTLSTLLTWALVDVDRQRIPWWTRWCVAGIMLALTAAIPDLLPVPWRHEEAFVLSDPNWLSALQTAAIGGLCGAVLGWLFTVGVPAKWRPIGPAAEDTLPSTAGHVITASIIIGMSVGWQAAMGVWLITLAIAPIVSWASSQWNQTRSPVTIALLIGYLVHLVCWRLWTVEWWPSCEATLASWMFWCVGFVVLCVANRWARRPASGLGESR